LVPDLVDLQTFHKVCVSCALHLPSRQRYLHRSGCCSHSSLTPPTPFCLTCEYLRSHIQGFRLDVRYATTNNFVHTAVYKEPRAVLQRPAAEALVRIAQRLEAETGLGLLIYDGYRPWAVTKMFWDLTPPEKRDFVADPEQGSKHNRGCAVDLSLCRPTSAAGYEAIKMPSDFDEMTDRAHSEYPGDPSLQAGSAEHAAQTAQRKMRDLLREHMERDGQFTVQYNEWWHFNFKDWEQYPVSDISFEEIRSTV
jgi:D-alanyl-D-alanine dipeptidase